MLYVKFSYDMCVRLTNPFEECYDIAHMIQNMFLF